MLGDMGAHAKNAVPDLIEMLGAEEVSRVRGWICSSLGKIGPSAAAAIPVLEEVKQSDDKNRRAAEKAIEAIQGG